MKTFNNDIQIHRGETFTIDKYIRNKDGSPYCISSKLNNPYWLISISNTRYEQKDRYAYYKWLPVNLPRVNMARPIRLTDIKTSRTGTQSNYTSFSAASDFPLHGYLNEQEVYLYPDDAIFYITDSKGFNTYKYYDINDTSESTYKWKDYDCRIITSISHEKTKEWVEQNYVYSINLVSGNTNTDENNTAPIVVDTSYPILVPTKLSVLSNIRGGL